MLKRYAPSQKKKKNSEVNFTPTPNQEECLGDDILSKSEEDMDESLIESSSHSMDSSDEEDSIEGYINHLEDIRNLSDQEFDWLKEDIRGLNTE